MNGTLAFVIEFMALVVGFCGSFILIYMALKIVKAIWTGKLDPAHLVSDKGSNMFSLHKLGQAVGMATLVMAFVYVVTHLQGEQAITAERINALVYLFAAVGAIMIVPQGFVNFLNAWKGVTPSPPKPAIPAKASP